MPYKTWLLAAILVLMPWAAHAAGLGKLTVLSALGQPLSAQIDLVSVQKDELATLSARIAAPEAFTQANVQYSPALVGARVSIEKRAQGQPYIKITSSRAINEPFLSVLVELSWAQGRLVREYTALIDPPGFAPGAPTSTPYAAVAPPVGSETLPIVPGAQAPAAGEAKPGAKGTATGSRRAAATGNVESKEYGPVKRGETLAKIAASVKPEAVTLEQMLVNLYRSNPDAFDGNMNRLKTGKILRVPEQEQIASTGQSEAVKEIRVQAADWNAYRQKLAGAAGEAPARESKSAASGKITTAVEDKASKEAPKEVLRLSKGEPAGKAGAGKGAARSNAERVRALEEEATAREKALADANDRIAQLEKTIKDMQRLLEVKGQVPPAVPAAKPAPSTAPGAKPEPAPPAKADQVAKADATKTEAAKIEPGKEAAKMEPAKEAAKMEPAKEEAKAPAVAPAPQPEVQAPPKPKPKPAPVVVPPQPSLLDQILGEPLYLAGIGGLLALLGVGGYLAMRRRSAQVEPEEDIREKAAPRLERAAPAIAPSPMTAPTAVGEDVDPIAEADLYLNFGRDAQAEEVLNEALEKNPNNEEAQLKLLQIYAGRRDKAAFEKVARKMHAQTNGTGEHWLKAAAMGFALDAANNLYEAGRTAPAAAVPTASGAPAAADLDFDFETLPTSTVTQTDVELDSTAIMPPGVLAGMAAASDTTKTAVQDITSDSAVSASPALEPDFTLEMPADTHAEPDITLDAPGESVPVTDVTGDSAAPMANVIDFNFDTAAPEAGTQTVTERKDYIQDDTFILNPEKGAELQKTLERTSTVVMVEPDLKLDVGGDNAAQAPSAAPQMPEFKLDDVNLNLDDVPRTDASAAAAAPVEGGPKDDHWYDVQTKFDLAKAYQEMGDQEGAREILQEVTKEGDAGQQAEAKKLLDSLG